MTTTTTFRVKNNTGWNSVRVFKTLKEAIKYAKELITDEDWQDTTHFYIEVIRITQYSTSKRSTDTILTKYFIFYKRNKDEWKLSKNYKVVKF